MITPSLIMACYSPTNSLVSSVEIAKANAYQQKLAALYKKDREAKKTKCPGCGAHERKDGVCAYCRMP